MAACAARGQSVLFSDAFTEPDGAAAGWTAEKGNWRVLSGTFNVQSQGGFATVDGFTFTDGLVSVVVASGPTDGGLLARTGGMTDGLIDGVYFVFRPADAYFHEVRNGHFLSEYGYVSHDALPASYVVQLEVHGTSFTGRILSADLGTTYATTTVTSTQFASGGVGVYSNSGVGGFDSFTITAVPESATSALGLAGAALAAVGVWRGRRRGSR